MAVDRWDINELIEETDLYHEQNILKDPNNLTVWLNYYRYKVSLSTTTFQKKVFLLERAVKQFPRSYKIWIMYLELVVKEAKGSDYNIARHEILMVNRLFDRALQLLDKAPMIWVKYLEFLIDKSFNEVTLIRRKFNEALYNLPITQHKLIWPLYISFANEIGGMTGVKVYLKYFQFANFDSLQGLGGEKGELNITIDEIISKLVEFGDIKESSKLFQYVLNNADKFIGLSKSPLQLWIEYIDLVIESVSSNRGNQNKSINYNEVDSFFEDMINDGLRRFPDQIAKFYLKITFYFMRRQNFHKIRSYFNKGLKECLTVQDFIMIFDAYTDFEEEILNKLGEKLESNENDLSLSTELDFRMNYFEQLVNSRPFLLSDMLLRQDENNLDEWFKRIKLYEDQNNLNKALSTYAQALTTINPFKAHSISNIPEYTLPNLWINYAKVYSNKNDFRTANLIFSKSVKSQFQTPDELAQLYIEWSELLLSNGDEEKAIEIIELAIEPPNETSKIDYQDSSIDVHLRIHKSSKLWSFYLDLLESMIDNGTQIKEIEKVIEAYNRLINLKIATPLTIINFSNFLEDWNFFEKSFSVYETGLKIFNDSKIKFEIWNIYLSKIIKHKLNIERIRDLFEQCLYGTGIGDEGCPEYLCKSVYILYSKFEQDNGSITRSIKILKEGLEKLTNGFNNTNYSKAERDKILKDKFDIYLILISKIKQLNDDNEIRKNYEMSLNDSQLNLPSLVELTKSFVEFETNLKEFARVRQLYKFICKLANSGLSVMKPVWEDWEQFELNYGDESSFKDMLRFKRAIKNEFENDLILKDSLNPMGFVKSTESQVTSSFGNDDNKDQEPNPDKIDLDMDM